MGAGALFKKKPDTALALPRYSLIISSRKDYIDAVPSQTHNIENNNNNKSHVRDLTSLFGFKLAVINISQLHIGFAHTVL